MGDVTDNLCEFRDNSLFYGSACPCDLYIVLTQSEVRWRGDIQEPIAMPH